MDYHDPTEQAYHEAATPPKRSIWQKLGAGSLSISIISHGILVLIGLIIVVKIIPPEEEKPVDFLPKSGGGGSPAAQSQAQKHRVQMTQPNLARVAAAGAVSNITLPEPEELTQMTSLGALSSGSMSKGLGGNGSGGGKGDGNGLGIGSGMAPGLSAGTGNKNPFGMVSAERGALTGTFYDLKQTRSGKPTEMTDVKMRELLKEITKRGFRDSVFNDYFKAPRQLYQTKLLIPQMPADGAPAAFEVEKEVQPRMWVVVYRGAVKAPKSGKFRFVGECDDFLVVRFNSRPVFDYGYTMAGTGTHVNGRADEFDGTKENRELENEVKKNTPMKFPIPFYKYDATPAHNRNIGGLAVGPEFNVEEGKTYPIDIMIGEIPGGYFSVALMIEEVGATYEKDPAGFPILPLFRLDTVPPADMKGESPPISQEGPVWKFVPGAAQKDI
ncbi:hypothetical protein JIN84_17010 [Luteolibacter yonseiensis]|uniref:PA14 domain-containing protein n=1 Tax=Luteolibacter yonseiensis TaxID=1144680 RepID=A0A934R2R3_9BACT|nr:hypothetical protein [Luteolibacter yonseiensis]MBK1817323.1 hypothetical protein [Luteolibacter yonseiensis]